MAFSNPGSALCTLAGVPGQAVQEEDGRARAAEVLRMQHYVVALKPEGTTFGETQAAAATAAGCSRSAARKVGDSTRGRQPSGSSSRPSSAKTSRAQGLRRSG